MSLLALQARRNGSDFLPEFLRSWSPTDLRKAVLMGLFMEVVERSHSVRFAVYPNADGTLGVVAILNVKDADESIAALRELSDYLVNGLGEAQPDQPVVSEAQLRSLVRQLSADEFQIRNRANTRLLLLGRQAIPELEKFRDSANKELAARVKMLLEAIDISQQVSSQTLLKGDLMSSIHPKLTYHVGAEKISNRSVDVIQMALPETEAIYQRQLEAMFGSQWNKFRVVRMEQQIIITLGSAGSLLDETLQNLEQNAPGLEQNPCLVQFPDDPHRLLAVHLPIGRLLEHKLPRNGYPCLDADRPRADRSADRVWPLGGQFQHLV